MITKEQVLDIQNQWGKAIVQIGALKEQRGACEMLTRELVGDLYAFETKTVLFKPTKTAETQFRGCFEGAISYFIGGNETFSEDNGFAIQPWTNVEFENSDVILENGRAIAMGNYFFTDTEGEKTKVEYTFGYSLDSEGELKIDLHHSSLPFSG